MFMCECFHLNEKENSKEKHIKKEKILKHLPLFL